ncbi:E3 ubiquitin/ISG15 ligase TRIM25-like [Lethenteron reissneri]|uniref:E3 ubiquitin/ISG15 ligase TRIM25-like n=1 Tax=Lethenteron reissneri TaxID=7753 RepID=UPI002AB70674|nr:E3 ubiquitin/ISG15 ligase TRIM25-like [Lethenteron reissneri]
MAGARREAAEVEEGRVEGVDVTPCPLTGSGEVDCRATFPQKPKLNKSVTLTNLVEQRSAADKMATVVFCDFCNDGTTAASKTCLKCDMSYCATHKQVGEETRAVQEKRREAEESVRRMEAARRDMQVPRLGQILGGIYFSLQGSMADEKASISVRFTRARAALDAEEKAALEQAELKGRDLLSQIEKKIAHYQREISELQAAATRLQALAQERDSLAFLQGHLEQTCLLCFHRTGRVTAAPPSAPSQEDIASPQVLETPTVKLLFGRSPTLDTNSANNKLQISSDLRTITGTGDSQRRPKHPHRFDRCPQALCCESFSSGHHYWEVDVGDAWWCRVGVTYGTISRKGSGAAQWLGGNDASWCLEKRDDNFSVVHGGVKTALSVRGAPSPRRIGLHLHWEGGLLEFYRADSMEVIHEVRQRFLQPLYPAMWVGCCNGPLKIVDLSRAS